MSSRRARKEAERAARLQREREHEAAERRRQRFVTVAAVAIAAPVVALVATSLGGGLFGGDGEAGGFPEAAMPPKRITDLHAAADAAGCVLKRGMGEGDGHTTDSVEYATNPPTSGDHHPIAADDGAYTKAPHVGRLVHSLEHGRIVVWFRPGSATTVTGQLKALFDEDPSRMLLVPREGGMPYDVAASAWNEQLACPEYNASVADAIRAFTARYRGRGPERVP